MRQLRNCSSCNKITLPHIFLRRPDSRSLRNYDCHDSSSSSYCCYYYSLLHHHHHHPLYAEVLGCTKNKQTNNQSNKHSKKKRKKKCSQSITLAACYTREVCMHARQQSIKQQLCRVACIIIIIIIIIII